MTREEDDVIVALATAILSGPNPPRGRVGTVVSEEIIRRDKEGEGILARNGRTPSTIQSRLSRKLQKRINSALDRPVVF